MKTIRENERPREIEGDPVAHLDNGLPGTRATTAAFIQAASQGQGSIRDIEDFRAIYEKNGKSEDFDWQVQVYKNARGDQAKEEIYDRVARQSRSFPVQVDFSNPEHAQIATDVVANYAANDSMPQIEMAVRGILEAAAKLDATNPHEMSIQHWNLERTIEIARDITRLNNDIEIELRAISQEVKPPDTVGGTISYFLKGLGFFIPGWDEGHGVYVAKAMGMPDYLMPSQMLNGEAMQNLREWLVSLSPEEKRQALRKFRHEFANNPAIADIVALDIKWSVLTDEVLFQNNPNDWLDRTLRNLGTVFNFGAGLAGIRKLGKMGALKIAASTNNRVTKRLLTELMTQLQNAPTLSSWGIKNTDVAESQLPRPPVRNADNLPDGVAQAAAHIERVRGDIDELRKNASEDIFTNQEITGAVERKAQEIESTFAGRLRLGRSSISILDDRSGVRFGSVIGSSDTHGFSSIDAARDLAKSLDESGQKVKILEVNGAGELKSIAAREGIEGIPNRQGEFYVQYDQEYFFRPEDKLLFGTDPVMSPTWLGRASLWFGTPSSVLSPEIYLKGVRAFLSEQALAARMDQLVAPVFKDLSWSQRRTVGEMYEWTEAFGKREGRVPSWDELQEAFPDSSNKELTGWYYLRQYYDTVYHINNDRLYREFTGRNYRTLRAGKTMYHGRPVSLDDMSRYSNAGVYTILDPHTLQEVNLSRAELKELYKNNGAVLELPIPVSTSGSKLSTLVLHNPQAGTRLEGLNKFPLQYTPGYYPRLYKDNIFIRRVTQGASINGRTTQHATAVAVAPDRRSAQDMIERLNRERGDDSVSYVIDEIDPRLSDSDRVARDLEQMQLEGRIFFDNRLADPLASTTGGRAEIVDPINALQRTSRILGRQLATEDLVRSLKEQFSQQYGALLGVDITKKTSAEVSTLLDQAIKAGNRTYSKQATQANAVWDYIRVMEGSLYGGGVNFRRAAVRGAEFLQDTVLPKGSRVGTLIARNAEKFAPVEWMKSLAFFDFMTTRPLRQLVLQGSQHVFLQGLDPTYAGKWQWDTFLLMSGARSRNLEMAGSLKEHKFLRTRNAKMMGVSLKEYDELVAQFNRSGLVEAVNMHTFASDLMKAPVEDAASRAGQIGKSAADIASAGPVRRALNKFGFQAGESFNVAASYMMAVRKIKAEKGYKKLTQFTQADWREAQARGSNYALAMHRANASKYQYGLLSLPMQFMSFTHKVFLTFLQALPDSMGGRLGNKSFTKGEARKLLAGQFLLFGASGFSLKPEAEQFLVKAGLDKYANGLVVDILSGGFLDIILDAAIQKAVNDPDLDLPFDEFLAPGANFLNVVRSFWEAGTKKTMVETALGPSFMTSSRLIEAASIANDMMRVDFPEWTPEQELEIVLDATLAGLASGYNDYLKARLAWRTGELLSQAGVPHKYNASREEALAKGLFGITSTGQKELWALTKDMRERQKELDQIASEYHARILNITQIYAEGDTYSPEYYRNRIALERAVLQGLPPEERTYVLEKFDALEAARKPTNDGVADYITQALSKNAPTPTEWLIYRLRQSNAVEPEDLPALETMLREQQKSLEATGELWDQTLEGSDAAIKKLEEQRMNPARGPMTRQEREALRDKALALPEGDLQGRAAIARQLGASEEEIQKILSRSRQ